MGLDSLKATLGLIDMINKTYSSISENKRIKNEYDNYEAKLQNIAHHKGIAEEKKNMAALQATNAFNNLKESKDNIKNRTTALQQMNISLDKIQNNVSSELQTDGFKDFSNITIENLNNNLNFDFDMANNTADTYSNMMKATEANNRVVETLDNMYIQVEGLQDQVALVGTEAGIAEWKDFEDFEAHVNDPTNASLFKEPKLDEFGNAMFTTNDKGETVPEYSEENNFLGQS